MCNTLLVLLSLRHPMMILGSSCAVASGCVVHVNVQWSARFLSLCRLKCFVAQISSHACRAVFQQQVFVALTSFWSVRRIDRQPSGESSLTSVPGARYLLRFLSLVSLDAGGSVMRGQDGNAYVFRTARSFRPFMGGACGLSVDRSVK